MFRVRQSASGGPSSRGSVEEASMSVLSEADHARDEETRRFDVVPSAARGRPFGRV